VVPANVPFMSSSVSVRLRDEVVAGLGAVNAHFHTMAAEPAPARDDAVLDERTAAAVTALRSAQEMVARLAAEAAVAGTPERDGCTSTGAWLIGRHGLSPRDAARAVAHGVAMTPACEPTRLAWARGEICGDRAEAIARAVCELPATANHRCVESAQRDLVERARTLTVPEVKREARRLVDLVDPADAAAIRAESLAAQERTAYDTATLRVRKGADGIARFSGTMPSLNADMLTANLDAIASPRRDHLRHGEDDSADGEEQVPYETRMGRALCDLIERARPSDLPAAGVNATVVVTIDERSLRDRVRTATLSTGDEISAGELRRLACSADILPAVLGGGSEVLDLGKASRLFDKRQRTALAVRDGGCVFPGCDRPPGWTEAHHVTPWSRGGTTDLGNAALLCGRHHRLIHQTEQDGDDGWSIQMADGRPEIRPPRRIDPVRRPRSNNRLAERKRTRQRSSPGAA
jgi:Domain of unknown function (DUF222)/HNH endonuclease